MKKNRILATILASSLSLSLLASCGTTASIEDKIGPDTIINLASQSDIISFDPHNHNDSVSCIATRHIYDNLIMLNDDGEFVGQLAKSWDFIDEMTVEFTLVEDVTFHNGEAFTSEDVKFSLERQMESAKVGHLVSMIEEVEVVDDYNFIIHLNEPSTALISSLAHSGGAMLDKTTVEALEASGETVEANPNGTGPYYFENWNPGESFSILRFDDYYGTVAANGGLYVRAITEESSRTIALETGEIDLVINVGSTDADRIRSASNLDLVEYESTHIEWFAFNTTVAPFDNVLVRQAINHAIDREAVITVAVNGEGEVNHSYLGSGAIGYSDDVSVYDYDLEKASELLAEAGLADGFEFSVMVSSDLRSRSAQAIQASLAQVGITMNINQVDSSVFFDLTGAGEHEALLSGWIANAEPDNTYRPLFHSSNVGAGGNRAFYTNDLVDDMIDAAAIEHDSEARFEMYDEILRIVSEDAIFAPLYTVNGLIGKNSQLQGFTPSAIYMHNYDQLHYVAE